MSPSTFIIFEQMKLKFHTDKPVRKFIDVKQLIADKSPKLANRLPFFLIRYLRRTLHEDDLNAIITENEDKFGYEFCKASIDAFEFDIRLHGTENIPRKGGCIFASNHPLGGMDANTLVVGLRGIRDDIRFIVNDVLLKLPNMAELFVGVNKHGRNAVKSLQKVDELFSSDKAVFLFPAGLVSRKVKGKIVDLEWKKTFITRAKKYGSPVIPVYINGRLSNFFYRLANLRTAFGIKANIEMLYLINELFKQHKKQIDIVFGKPIPADHFDKSRSDKAWAHWVKEEAYALKTQIEDAH